MRLLKIIFLTLLSNILYGNAETIKLTTPLDIKSYSITEIFAIAGKKKVVVTRELTLSNNNVLFLCIDAENLNTFFCLKDGLHFVSSSFFSNTLYFKIKNLFVSNKKTFGETNEHNNFHSISKKILLTTDLCPSTNEFDYDFYTSIEEVGVEIPFIIFFSGGWITNHKKELDWIKQNRLNFLAGNHTYNHHIIKGEFPEERLITEITNTEIEMLKNGLMPSCFFRFPGLKYNAEHIETLAKLNLIPLGVNFWAGQKCIPEYSILLAHSNGNVKKEIELFKKFLSCSSLKLKNKEIEFLTPEKWLKHKI